LHRDTVWDQTHTALASRIVGSIKLRRVDGPRQLPANFAAPDAQERQVLRDYLSESALGGALLVRCAFGFTDVNATQYWFACDTVLVDHDGQPVWRYYGKAWMLQSLGQNLRPEELLRQLSTPLEPPAGSIVPEESVAKVTGNRMVPTGYVAGMEAVCDSYAHYVLWCLEMDLAGEPGDNSYANYLLPSKNTNIVVSPASSSLPPFVFDAPARKR